MAKKIPLNIWNHGAPLGMPAPAVLSNSYFTFFTLQARPQNNTFRSFYNGLDPIPEYGITDSPKVFQPLVPPPVPPPKMATTTSYNIR